MPVKPDPIRRDCRSTYTAYHHSGPRLQSALRYIVLHSSEGPTAESAAQYFETPQAKGSANLVLDQDRCYRVLGDLVIPWGAPPLNTHGFHIEQAGYAHSTRAEWLARRRTIRRAAYKAALRCKWYGIPARLLDAGQLKADFGDRIEGGVPAHPGPLKGGIVTHATISEAFHASTHTDPGEGYPLDVFMELLTGYLEGDL